ncbi:LOW QUALITY PROTEIN: uncharacterized protein LOC123504352 [Portunus trituberculatus]|uniref:LOW QUALITY PROTEIN: uncharacterized protein LOC123504352 n=1 Tax=Portunus trituberculatus TaxID=210409 RepID=UPI001E1CF771|nr:LOW QUALITY PROTEIN: uncharacterized protein LOC123504352 [Portunus trituberculatus]
MAAKMCRWPVLVGAAVLVLASAAAGLTGFEKLTELDYRGSTYYTIRNLSLWECQGWCREEPECAAASFSFVVNPLAPIQETLCLLQNETMASNPTAKPKRSVSLYYMVKLHIDSDKVCNRPWTFERVPNKVLKKHNDAQIFVSSKEYCMAACLNERRFVCRSAEYDYVTLQCQLSQYDRRSAVEGLEMVDKDGVDYFENLCLSASDSCQDDEREFEQPQYLGVPLSMISHYVDVHYYVDKELMANSDKACERACIIEKEILCRSFLYKGPPTGSSYNCQLFHLDHYTLPDGPSTFLSTDRPLMDDGQRTGTYYENVCRKPRQVTYPGGGVTAGLGGGVIGGGSGVIGGVSDGNIGSGVIGGGSNSGVISGGGGGLVGGGVIGGGSTIYTPRPGTFGSSSSSFGSSQSTPGQGFTQSPNVNCDPTGVCYDVSVHCKDTRIVVDVGTNEPFNGRIYALGRSETCNIQVINSDKFRLDLSLNGQDCNTQSANGVYTNTVVIQHHSIVMTKTDKIYKIRCTYDMTSKNITFGMLPISSSEHDPLSNTLIVRDPDMIPITSTPEAPPPKIRILDAALREVETVRIGDILTFRIEIPDTTPYGIFARSCVAMAKDSRSTFQIIDDDGCPVEPSIFPAFKKDGYALQSVYEAFRFTESYGVIFQCNVKYCLGPCEPARCQVGKEQMLSFGRKKRGVGSPRKARGHAQETTKEEAMAEAKALTSTSGDENEMSISQEILVLDFGDEQQAQYRDDPAKPNASTHPNHTHTYDFEGPDVTLFETCPTRSSVLALAVTCAILLLIYVLTVFYFVMRKWFRPPKSMR